MKITEMIEVETVTDIVCDVCGGSTHLKTGGHQFGTLKADWGYGTTHDGERYEVHLCEQCFFQALANLKQERRTHTLFSEDGQDQAENLGLVAQGDYFDDAWDPISSPRK
ncbi:hypothetical protein V0M98_36640 (plasmid) [Pseudomonas silesiensis]|uniref:hypothetical protein n=1 Tax=Pseudomonas silesiensis TaxID=1853130 RepID=UPI0030D387C3